MVSKAASISKFILVRANNIIQNKTVEHSACMLNAPDLFYL